MQIQKFFHIFTYQLIEHTSSKLNDTCHSLLANVPILTTPQPFEDYKHIHILIHRHRFSEPCCMCLCLDILYLHRDDPAHNTNFSLHEDRIYKCVQYFCEMTFYIQRQHEKSVVHSCPVVFKILHHSLVKFLINAN